MVLELCSELRNNSIETIIGIFDNSHNPHLQLYEQVKKRGLQSQVFLCRGQLDVNAVKRIRSFTSENGFDVIHSHGYKSDFYLYMAAKGLAIKKVATCHNWIGTGLKMKFYEALDKRLLRSFDKVITVSEVLRGHLIAKGFNPETVQVIRNGIDFKRFEPFIVMPLETTLKVKRSLGVDSNNKVIGTVGRLTEEKGLRFLFESFKDVLLLFPNTTLLIIGDGPLKERLALLSGKLGIKQKTIFAGTRNDIPQLLGIIDIFAMPSLTEGMPIALLEAMAAKKEIVASRVGEIPNLIVNGYSGLVVEPRDHSQLTTSLVRLLQNPADGERFAEAAYDYLRKNFSSVRMAESYIKVYESCMNNKISYA